MAELKERILQRRRRAGLANTTEQDQPTDVEDPLTAMTRQAAEQSSTSSSSSELGLPSPRRQTARSLTASSVGASGSASSSSKKNSSSTGRQSGSGSSSSERQSGSASASSILSVDPSDAIERLRRRMAQASMPQPKSQQHTPIIMRDEGFPVDITLPHSSLDQVFTVDETCYRCSRKIMDPRDLIEVLGETFCQGCFKCHNCVGDLGFPEGDSRHDRRLEHWNNHGQKWKRPISWKRHCAQRHPHTGKKLLFCQSCCDNGQRAEFFEKEMAPTEEETREANRIAEERWHLRSKLRYRQLALAERYGLSQKAFAF